MDSAASAASLAADNFFAVPLAVHAIDAANVAFTLAASVSSHFESVDEYSAAASNTNLVASTADNATIKV